MRKQEFLKQYKNDTSKTSVIDIVYGELVEYCRDKDIDEDDLATEQLEEIAEHIVQEREF